jgi:hypothetical protein
MIFVMRDDEVWDAATSTLRLQDAERRHGCTWSFDGERMSLRIRSRGLACSLAMRGGSQVMWAKDKLGKEGLIQEGPEGDYSFYYSLPRLEVSGSISHVEDGRPTTSDVGGFGWVDRQWGDFLTSAWEWASLRFTSGARVNLYNFYNGHRVATYQKPDGSTQWFDDFVVKQNGYARTSLGTWVSYGWSYEFPVDVEGSRHYRLEPFSKLDMVKGPGGKVFYEGPSHLVDETTGKTVGISVNESMDVRVMGNAPYGPHQR